MVAAGGGHVVTVVALIKYGAKCILHNWKFSPGEFSFLFLPMCEFLCHDFLSHVNDYIEPVVIFTTCENLFHKIFLKNMGMLAGRKFLSSESLAIWYLVCNRMEGLPLWWLLRVDILRL